MDILTEDINSFDQIKGVTEIDFGLLVEIIKNYFPEDDDDYSALTKISENYVDNNTEINKIKLLEKFNLSDKDKIISIINLYNSFLTQYVPVDENSRRFLNKSIIKDRKENDKKVKNNFYYFNVLSENINYTTFKIILDDIVKNNDLLENYNIYQTYQYVDQYQHIDYQVVLKLSNGKTKIFGIDLKNLENHGENNLVPIYDKTFVPIALDYDGTVRNYNKIKNDISEIKSGNTRKRNRYEFNIFPELQESVNKRTIAKELNVELTDFDHLKNDGFDEIYDFLNEIVKKEIGTLDTEDTTLETKEEVREKLVGYDIEELEEIKRKKENKINEKKILDKAIKAIKEQECIRREYTVPIMRVTGLPNNIEKVIEGEMDLATFIYNMGEKDSSDSKKEKNLYNLYNFINDKCQVTTNVFNGTEKKYYKITRKKSTVEKQFNNEEELKKFNEILEYAKIKLKEEEILKLVNEGKSKISIEEREKILELYIDNFTEIHFSDEDYKNFNDKFSYDSLQLLDPKIISKLLSNLNLLINLDDKIAITREEILSLENGKKINKKIEKEKIVKIINSKKRSINDKFILLKYYDDKAKLTKKDIIIIKDIYSTTFKQYNTTFFNVNATEISNENKFLMFKLFENISSRIDEKIMGNLTLNHIYVNLKNILGEEYIKEHKNNVSFEKNNDTKLQKDTKILDRFSKSNNLLNTDFEEINQIIKKYFPNNANNFRLNEKNTND